MVSNGSSILLVEDDENDVLFTQLALKAAEVANPMTMLTDGQQALDYFQGKGEYADRGKYPLPYLVLLDLKLPMVVGLDVLKWLRARPEFNSTIVVVLTASGRPADVATAYRLGANSYLVKPSSLDRFREMALQIKNFWLGANQPGSEFTPAE